VREAILEGKVKDDFESGMSYLMEFATSLGISQLK
jgi:hypothetical protein